MLFTLIFLFGILFGVIMQISSYQVYVHELLNYVDPFSRWIDIDSAISINEVSEYISMMKNQLLEIHSLTSYAFDWSTPISLIEARLRHIHQIAYFVRNDIQDDISIDTYCNGLVDDGHHRLCACVIKQQKQIGAQVSGNIDTIKQLFPLSIKAGILLIDNT